MIYQSIKNEEKNDMVDCKQEREFHLTQYEGLECLIDIIGNEIAVRDSANLRLAGVILCLLKGHCKLKK